MSVDFGRMQKDYFQLRGELQGGSITGVNSDERYLCKKLLNEEMRYLVDLHPPFAHSRWHIRAQTSVTLKSSGTNSITGSKNRPWLIDSVSTKLYKRNEWNEVSNGSYRRVITSVSVYTDAPARNKYFVDSALNVETTSSDEWTARKVHYPLPPDVGFIDTLWYEDGELPIHITRSVAEFEAYSKCQSSSSTPYMAGLNVFSNKWGQQKHSETGMTTLQNSRLVTAATDAPYDIGDVMVFNGKYIHHIEGISTTDNTLWLDRPYVGTTAFVTGECNPNEHTEYLTLWRSPDSDKDIIIDGYRRPVPMVADTDVSIFPDRLVPTIVIGALMRDKWGREVLTQSWLLYYEKMVKELRKKKNNTHYPAPRGWNNRGNVYTGGDYDFSSIGR